MVFWFPHMTTLLTNLLSRTNAPIVVRASALGARHGYGLGRFLFHWFGLLSLLIRRQYIYMFEGTQEKSFKSPLIFRLKRIPYICRKLSVDLLPGAYPLQ